MPMCFLHYLMSMTSLSWVSIFKYFMTFLIIVTSEKINSKLPHSFSFFQINASSTEDGLNFYDSGHRFEHLQLLLVLLRSLPYASKAFQSRALQVCPMIIWCCGYFFCYMLQTLLFKSCNEYDFLSSCLFILLKLEILFWNFW